MHGPALRIAVSSRSCSRWAVCLMFARLSSSAARFAGKPSFAILCLGLGLLEWRPIACMIFTDLLFRELDAQLSVMYTGGMCALSPSRVERVLHMRTDDAYSRRVRA